MAAGLVGLYNGTQPGQIPGIFGSPYYWWESGAVWDGLINYWALTGDDEYNDVVGHALEFQVGSNKNFEPVNQTASEVCSKRSWRSIGAWLTCGLGQ